MAGAKRLASARRANLKAPAIGVFAACDPRIDEDSRTRTKNIVEHVANTLAEAIKTPNGQPVDVVWSPVLIDGEQQADIVAEQFKRERVGILVCTPDTWAFPQLTTISLLSHFPKATPINLTCGNSGPKPGVVYTHALAGALTQSGKMVHINVGSWPDTGLNPKMSKATATALIDWCYAALTAVALRGRRVMVLGHDSMGMETALAHVIPTRNTFGLEIARLDMKLLCDMLNKGAYDEKERREMRAFIDKHVGRRLELRDEADSERFDQSLVMYLIVRDLMRELNAVGGGFMSQLEWGSDLRGQPLPVADAMESFFNSSFDHNGPKPPLPFATEADVQGLLTMLFQCWLTGGAPPLFMDFRKVWEPHEIAALAKKHKVEPDPGAPWMRKGLVDGNNSGSAALDWAGRPGTKPETLLKRTQMPLADPDYFPGGGNSVTFISPGGIHGIAARLNYAADSNMFSMVWDEAETVAPPKELAQALVNMTNWNWPHTFIVPKYASMLEYKQFAPANHFHMVWNLPPARLQYWMDLTNVFSVTPWAARPSFVEEVDRPAPLIHLVNGGETAAKRLLAR